VLLEQTIVCEHNSSNVAHMTCGCGIAACTAVVTLFVDVLLSLHALPTTDRCEPLLLQTMLMLHALDTCP
jgi:hypothetical protein